MFLFRKKEKKKKGMEIPVDIVKSLSSKGMSEPEIVAVLRKQGYSPYEIEKAISLALKSTVSGNSPQPFPSAQPPSPSPPGGQGFSDFQGKAGSQPSLPEFHTMQISQSFQPQTQALQAAPEASVPSAFPKPQPLPARVPEKKEVEEEKEELPPEPEQASFPDLTLEEIIEGIVAEKWQSFEEHLERLRKRDDELQKQIMDLRKEIESIREAMRKSEETFIAKLEEQGEQVASIGARIGSIEKVFKEFLPELTESMRIITDALEKSKQQKVV